MTQPTQPLPSDNSLAARKARVRLDATLKALSDQRDAALNIVVNLQTDKAELLLDVEVLQQHNAVLEAQLKMSKQSNSELMVVISNLQAQVAELSPKLEGLPGSDGPVGNIGEPAGDYGNTGPLGIEVQPEIETEEFKVVVETPKEPGLIERVKSAATNLVSGGDKN